MLDPVDLTDARILITGATGQVAVPAITALAKICDVTALARFSNADARSALEAQGVRCVAADLATPQGFSGVPADVDYVINFAVTKTGDFDYDLAANAEGLGLLMQHCRTAHAFLHFSSTAVYAYAGQAPRAEDAPLGDNHRMMFPTYSISKIAAESVARFSAQAFELPTTIARLSVPYGDNGGWPFYHLLMMKEGIPIDLHPEHPNQYNLLHSDDYIAKIPLLLAAATTNATVVNFGGSESTSIEDWCAYLTELTGIEPVFKDNPEAFGSLHIDTQRMHDLIGPTQVDWRDGIRRMVTALAPELLR
ncbi:MAG: NAD(P)-dependent oxidoreductase [Pseudomonadota bacterium]